LEEAVTKENCPGCGQLMMRIYFDEQTGEDLAGVCGFCGLKGYLLDHQIIPVAR
jgi:hypothetical protein